MKVKMSDLHKELNQKKYIILNEFSEKNIDDLYSFCCSSLNIRLESTNGNSIQHNIKIIKEFVKNNPSNYLWKSLENNYQYSDVIKDCFRMKKLSRIFGTLYSDQRYYADVYYLKI